jgi:MFS family permease
MQSFGAAFPKVYADDSFRGWFVSTLLLAAWFQSLFNGPVADRLGRKLSMIVAVVIFLPSEIFTLSSRFKTISITISATWMCNFVIGLGTPTMHSTLGWGTYIFFAAFCALAFLFAWFCVPETKAKSLEDMDAVFGNSAAHEQKLQLYQVAAELQETETSVVMDDKV